MKKFITLALLFLIVSVKSQTVTYQSDITNFANPERGWYKYTKSNSVGAFSFLSQSSLTSMRTNEKITLILRIYDLGAFKTKPISQTFLNNVKTDFNTLRASGVKCVLRFRYSETDNIDAKKDVLINHINQLKTITIPNQDVIHVVEAGFIGRYGEWYYTSNYGDKGVLTTKNLADRKEIGLKIMELAPEKLIMFRTPKFQTLVGGATLISTTTAYNGSINSRTGLHNDAFLSSNSDSGTFRNTTTEYTYLDAQSKYTFCGGESNALFPAKQDCSVVFGWLTRFHYNYLNFGYYPATLDLWKTGGCYDEIQRRLGYRFELTSSSISNNILAINIKNIGFCNIFNSRPVFLIFKNKSTGLEYSKQLSTDLRFWNAGVTTTILEPINYTFPDGNYDLFLWIPDNVNRTSQYAIRLANVGVWDSTKGYNNLLQTITINNLAIKIGLNNRVINVSGVSNYAVKVYDMQGLLVSEDTNTSKLRSGIYIVKVKVDGVVYSKKISL